MSLQSHPYPQFFLPCLTADQGKPDTFQWTHHSAEGAVWSTVDPSNQRWYQKSEERPCWALPFSPAFIWRFLFGTIVLVQGPVSFKWHWFSIYLQFHNCFAEKLEWQILKAKELSLGHVQTISMASRHQEHTWRAVPSFSSECRLWIEMKFQTGRTIACSRAKELHQEQPVAETLLYSLRPHLLKEASLRQEVFSCCYRLNLGNMG